MRCCSSLSALAVLFALLVLTASAASAQVTAGGNVSKGGIRVDADLTAAAEVPGPGDPNLSGSATLTVDPRRKRICFDVDLDAATPGADNVVALHLHPGVAGEACAGDDCPRPINLNFAKEGLKGCTKKLGSQLLNSIVDEPEQFYLHVHTSRFPAGAVRGQLED